MTQKDNTPNTYPDIAQLSYDEAITQTEALLTKLENEELPIDTILAESRRVVALIAHCREKMKEVGAEVDEILKKLRQEHTPTPEN